MSQHWKVVKDTDITLTNVDYKIFMKVLVSSKR